MKVNLNNRLVISQVTT